MNWIFWIIIAVAVLVIIQAIRQWRKKTADYALLSERVHYLQTNTYALSVRSTNVPCRVAFVTMR